MDTAIIDNLRGVANFVRRHGRMPSSTDELIEGMTLVEPFPSVEITDAALRRHLREWDAIIQFFEAHHRLPRMPEEMPPTD